MTLKINILDYFLPNEILCEIFSKYLIVQDISRFDVAICNHGKRKVFLECIGSVTCIWLGDKERKYGRQGINWLHIRKMKIRHLNLKCHNIFSGLGLWSALHMAQKISDICICLDWLSFDKFVKDASLIRIVEGCANIKSFHLCPNENATDKSIIKIAEGCPLMQTLDLGGCHNITDLSIIRIAEMCPLMQSFCLNGCFHITDFSVIRIAEGCPLVQMLKVRGCRHLTDISITMMAERCPLLQNLDLGSCNVTDSSVIRIAEICPLMQSLKLVDRLYQLDSITDFSIIKIAEGCPLIQSLELIRCHNVTDLPSYAEPGSG